MYPLSFAEFMTVYNGHYYDGFNEYMTYGGIPIVALADTSEQKMALLENLFRKPTSVTLKHEISCEMLVRWKLC